MMKGHSVFAKRMIKRGEKYVIIWEKYVHTLCLKRGIIIIIKVVVKVTFLNLNTRRNAGQSMLLRRITLSVV